MKSILSILLVLFLLFPFHSHAAQVNNLTTPEVSAKLISDSAAIGAKKTIWLGLDLDLADGWHTYWKLPGETGEPPAIDWNQSTNIESAKLLFPAPKRIETALSDMIGYEGHVTFPIKVTVKETNKDTRASANVTLLLCKELCVPKIFTLSLNFKAGPYQETTNAAYLHQILETVPAPNEKHDLKIVKAERHKDGFTIKASGLVKQFTTPDLFIDNPEGVLFDRPTFVFSPCKKSVTITAKLLEPLDDSLSMETLPLTVSIVDGKRMIEESIPNTDLEYNKSSFAYFILIALLGGLVLNLMPCVLPVLSLKLMTALKQSGQESHEITRSFLATSAGIITSFMILALITIGLKYTGHILGWGIQFQQPLFLLFMIILLTMFAANMWGMFTIGLPSWLLTKMSKPGLPKLSGDFGTGMFATLLATPCTAPFLGTALGFALTTGAKEILLIFFALGFGMSLPFILVAAWPSCAKLLPKPGMWMEKISTLLGFGLAGTAIWLIFVLKAQVGSALIAIVGISILAIVSLLYMHSRNILDRYVLPLIIFIIVCAFVFLGLSDPAPEKTVPETQWQTFQEAKIQDTINNNKVVFVDITADWCLNCKFNKKIILSQREIRLKLFHNKDVVALQGDWTSPDPVLSNYLHKNGRYGIPFNAIYGPKAPNGILLPEILTPKAIMDAIKKAR